MYPPAQAGSEQHSATLRLNAGEYELVRSDGRRETGTYSTVSIALKLAAACPSTAIETHPYTATGTTLSFATVSEHVEEVFTKE